MFKNPIAIAAAARLSSAQVALGQNALERDFHTLRQCSMGTAGRPVEQKRITLNELQREEPLWVTT